ncbi:MAG: sugar-binding protein, partial [Candidatus Buchananbacteria bacterium]
MIDDSIIDENDLLINYIPTIKDKSLKVLNLLRVSANHVELNLVQNKEVSNYISKVLKSAQDRLTLQHPDLDIKKTDHLNDKDILKTIAQLSLYFDSENVTGHLSPDSLIPNYFPDPYIPNIVYFAGWNVLKLGKQTIFWNFFSNDTKSLLLIKVVNLGISTAVTYESKSIPSPFDNNKSDLLQSPIATNILKSLLVQKSNNSFFETDFEKQLQEIKSSKLTLLYMHDLLSHAKTFENIGKVKKADSLYHLYEEKFPEGIPVKYLKQPVIAEFNYVSNNFDGKKYFELKQDTKVRLFGSGQISNDRYLEWHLQSTDAVELYLDPFNRKTKLINLDDKQCLYRFNYGYDSISGYFLSKKDIEFSFADPNDSIYILELKIPWKTILGKLKPRYGQMIGLNAIVGDDDMNDSKWKNGISWSTKDWKIDANNPLCWGNPSNWGNLILESKSISTNPKHKVMFCPKITTNIKIDGKIDYAWNKTRYTQILHPTGNLIPSRFDNSGSFKAVWDNQYLYLLFKVSDNVKSPAGLYIVDKGWIENYSSGEIAYKMIGSSKSPSFPTFSVDKTIFLKAGKYFLRYTSDEGHSIEKWYGRTPANYIYGAVLYKCIE